MLILTRKYGESFTIIDKATNTPIVEVKVVPPDAGRIHNTKRLGITADPERYDIIRNEWLPQYFRKIQGNTRDQNSDKSTAQKTQQKNAEQQTQPP